MIDSEQARKAVIRTAKGKMRKLKRNFSKVKILKPKDRYNRFKVFGRVFQYREQDVKPTAFLFCNDILTEYGAIAECDDNLRYVVHFYRIKGEYVPFNIESYRGWNWR